MIDTVQLVLLLVIVILTILLVVLGIQVYFILKDLRRTLQRADHVLENAGTISDNIAGPMSSLGTLINGLKVGSVITIAKLIRSLLSKEDDNEKKREK